MSALDGMNLMAPLERSIVSYLPERLVLPESRSSRRTHDVRIIPNITWPRLGLAGVLRASADQSTKGLTTLFYRAQFE